MPQRFDISYVGADGEKHRPGMIHRTIFGSMERFIGILIEHFEGKFPLWLAPTQVKLLTVTEKFNDFAQGLKAQLSAEGFRVEMDGRNEKIGYKIREARNARDAYIIVIGEKEMESGMFPVRSSKKGELDPMSLPDLIGKLHLEIDEKAY
jgi:threonyl-tRNA synthetase